MALALDLTPRLLSTGASAGRGGSSSSAHDASVLAHHLPALPSSTHAPLSLFSSSPPTASIPTTTASSATCPSTTVPTAPASRSCPSQPTTTTPPRSGVRLLSTPPASASNSRPSTPPLHSPHSTSPGSFICPPVSLTRSSSFSSLATDDSDVMDLDDCFIREQLCSGDWQRYPPLKATEPPAQAPSPVPSSFDTHETVSSRASFDENALPMPPYVDGFSTYIHPSLRKHPKHKHTKSSSGGAHPERTSSRQASHSHLRRSKSATNFASMFPSDEAAPPVPPLPIHTSPYLQRTPVFLALMMKGPYPMSTPDRGLHITIPASPKVDAYSIPPPPLPPKTPDLPKSTAAELASINEAAAVAVRRRTRSGPQQPMPLVTSHHGNLSRSVDAPPRLHTTKSVYATTRHRHRRAHSAQHAIPDFTLPSRSTSRQSLKESISAPSPVLPNKLMPSSYHAPYASTRAAPSPPKTTNRRPIGSHRPAPPPPDIDTTLSGQRALPRLPKVPGSPVAAVVSPTSPLRRSLTLPAIASSPQSAAAKNQSARRRLSASKHSVENKENNDSDLPSPRFLEKQRVLALHQAEYDEAIAAIREAETWDWPVPPNVPALERSSSISTTASSPTRSLAELAADWEAANSGLVTELEEREMQRNVSSTFSSDMGPLTPDEHDDRGNPFDALDTPVPAVASASKTPSPRSAGNFGVPF